MKKKKKSRKPSSSNPINGSDSSTFHVSIATTAVAQICHSAGFKSTQTTALQTLTNITIRYLTSLATSSATSASSSGRTESNLYDVIRGMEEVHADVGFRGCSEMSLLGGSEMLKGLVRFVEWGREVPFAKALRKVAPSSRSNVETRTPLSGGGEKGVFSEVNEGKSEGEEVPRGSYCGEKEAVNEGKSVGEDVPRGKQIVKSLCENERLNGEKSYCVEKEAVKEGKSVGKKKVPRGKQMVTSLNAEKRVITAVNEGENQSKVPRGKRSVTSLYGECNGNEGENVKKAPRGNVDHVPKWLPDFPKKEVFTAEVNEGKKSVSENEKVNYYYKEVSELPEVRKKVRFEIKGKTKTRRVKDVIKVKLGGVDLRSGVCKGGKRILFEIYENVVKEWYGKKEISKGG